MTDQSEDEFNHDDLVQNKVSTYASQGNFFSISAASHKSTRC